MQSDGRGDERVVVIGGGHAAGRLAERLRHHGHRGGILIVGEEPHPPYERPGLSKQLLTSEEEWTPPQLLEPDASVALRTRVRAVAIDRASGRVHFDDGTAEPYDRLVIATGLSPRRLASLSGVENSVFSLHTLDQAHALRQRLRQGGSLAVIGAGFLGLEVASSARAMGIAVDVVELGTAPLQRILPPLLGRRLAALHRLEGSRLHLGASVSDAIWRSDAVMIGIGDGAPVTAGTVLCSIGGVPRDSVAAEAGLETADGVLVDAEGRTSDPRIFAIGDVARRRPDGSGLVRPRIESWRNAEDSAAISAAAICGLPPPPKQGEPSFWTDQIGRRIQFLGYPSAEALIWDNGVAPFNAGYGAFLMQQGRLRQAIFVSAPRIMRAAREVFARDGEVSTADLAKLGMQPAQEDCCSTGEAA